MNVKFVLLHVKNWLKIKKEQFFHFIEMENKNRVFMIVYFTLFLVLFALPSLISLNYSSFIPVNWIISSIILGIILPWLRLSQTKFAVLISIFVAVLITFLNSLSFVSFWLQGQGITREVLWHFDVTNLPTVIKTFKIIFFVAIFYLVISIPFWAIQNKFNKKRVFSWVLLLFSLTLFTPLQETISVLRTDKVTEPYSPTELVNKYFFGRMTSNKIIFTRKPPNILIIYMESLEQTYLDEEKFGDITVNLKKQLGKSVQFSKISQTFGTGWTIAGIFSSHCGFPLLTSTSGNQALAAFNPNSIGAGSFSSILNKNGYNTVFMGGADTNFGGKKSFLMHNGYDEVLGRTELITQIPDEKKINEWGLYDDDLLDLVYTKLETLTKEKKPFLLTTLTVDTHHPNGTPSKSIPKVSDDNIINAVNGSDKIISNLLQKIKDAHLDKNLMIVILSDHLAMRNTVSDILDKTDDRYLIFGISAPWLKPAIINKPGTHFDIGPTILNAAGILNYGKFPLGQSLLRHDSGFMDANKITYSHFKGFDIIKLSDKYDIKSGALVFDAKEQLIQIGNKIIPITFEGRKMYQNRVFIAQFNEEKESIEDVFTISMDPETLRKQNRTQFINYTANYIKPPKNKIYIIFNAHKGFFIIQNKKISTLELLDKQELRYKDL